MERVNLDDERWDERRERAGYAWRRRGLGGPLGGELLGASLYELASGQATWPYHWHWANEELLVVVAGTPTLRDPGGERELGPADVTLFPRGPRGAHQIVNRSDAPARVLMVSTTLHPEVAEYPDDGTILLAAGAPPTPGLTAPFERVFRKHDAVDHWEDASGPTTGPA